MTVYNSLQKKLYILWLIFQVLQNGALYFLNFRIFILQNDSMTWQLKQAQMLRFQSS